MWPDAWPDVRPDNPQNDYISIKIVLSRTVVSTVLPVSVWTGPRTERASQTLKKNRRAHAPTKPISPRDVAWQRPPPFRRSGVSPSHRGAGIRNWVAAPSRPGARPGEEHPFIDTFPSPSPCPPPLRTYVRTACSSKLHGAWSSRGLRYVLAIERVVETWQF